MRKKKLKLNKYNILLTAIAILLIVMGVIGLTETPYLSLFQLFIAGMITSYLVLSGYITYLQNELLLLVHANHEMVDGLAKVADLIDKGEKPVLIINDEGGTHVRPNSKGSTRKTRTH